HARRVLCNHMSLERLLAMIRSNYFSQVREIHLLHLSDGNSDVAAFRAAVYRATGKPVFVAPTSGVRREERNRWPKDDQQAVGQARAQSEPQGGDWDNGSVPF